MLPETPYPPPTLRQLLDDMGRELRHARTCLVLARLAQQALVEEDEADDERQAALAEAATLATETAERHAAAADELHWRVEMALQPAVASPLPEGGRSAA